MINLFGLTAATCDVIPGLASHLLSPYQYLFLHILLLPLLITTIVIFSRERKHAARYSRFHLASRIATWTLHAFILFSIALNSLFDGSFIIASGTSPDGQINAAVVRGINLEGDRCIVVYHKHGTFWWYHLAELGGDLNFVKSARFSWDGGPNHIRVWETIRYKWKTGRRKSCNRSDHSNDAVNKLAVGK